MHLFPLMRWTCSALAASDALETRMYRSRQPWRFDEKKELGVHGMVMLVVRGGPETPSRRRLYHWSSDAVVFLRWSLNSDHG